MCGISGIISKRNENMFFNILDSLQQLENRGYDSTGISYIEDKKIKEIKKASSNAIEYIKSKNIQNSNIIGHTRWATHGAKTDENAHPHLSTNKLFSVVHNGIIENYEYLKTKLENKIFISETDTEVIVNLIELEYEKGITINEAITNSVNQLEGTYGLAIQCVDEPESIYVIRNGSPLLIGENSKYVMVTSEISGFNNQINNYISISNNDLIKIHKYGISTNFKYIQQKINIDKLSNTMGNYSHWTEKEIYEQNESMKRAINFGGRISSNSDSVILGGLISIEYIRPSIKTIILLGCGTSFNACLLGKKYIQELNNHINIHVIDAGDFTIEDIVDFTTTIVILCSQSGETRDLYKCISLIKNKSPMIGIVNVVDSLISKECDCGIYLNAGREIGVASTKSYTSMLIVLRLISIWFNNSKSKQITDIIMSLRNLVFHKFSIQDYNYKIVNSILDHNSLFILGKGKLEFIAKEASLKFKEMCYIHAEGYSGTALKHGPFALLDENTSVILLINKETERDMIKTYEEIKSRCHNIIIITDTEKTYKNDFSINIKYSNEILYIVQLQFIAYQFSLFRNINPDKPRNLAKVVTVD